MKTKEYISNFNISNGWNSKIQKAFIDELTSEFLAACELNKSFNNIKGFENAVKMIRLKWDAISNKIPYGLPDKLWNYFYATVIAKVREELCPREMQRRREEAAERQRRRDEWNEMKREQERRFQEWYEESQRSFYEKMMGLLLGIFDSIPVLSFKYFGLEHSTATKDQVMSKYKELAVKLHPDRGGKQEDFIQLVEHKNKCINYINNK